MGTAVHRPREVLRDENPSHRMITGADASQLPSPLKAALEAVQRQQKLHDEQEYLNQPGYGSKLHTQSRSQVCEISQIPQGANQELASQRQMIPPKSKKESEGEVPGLGIVFCNKNVIVSSGQKTSPGGLFIMEGTEDQKSAVKVDHVQIKRIIPNTPASMCDAIAAGDEVLAVNSVCCRGKKWQHIVALSVTSVHSLNEHFGRSQPIKPLHIISRQCSSTSRGNRRENLCHSSIVCNEGLDHRTDAFDYFSFTRSSRSGDNEPDIGLCASLDAVEEALYDKVLTPRDKGNTTCTTGPGGNVRKDGYQTTWRCFPMISFSVCVVCLSFVSLCACGGESTQKLPRSTLMAKMMYWQAHEWSPSDVRTFLEWLFWRQGSGFSISPSEYSRIPGGIQFLGMSDKGFGSMGFTHDEVYFVLFLCAVYCLLRLCCLLLTTSVRVRMPACNTAMSADVSWCTFLRAW